MVLQARLISHFYKISKIVRGLWLAERRVCMGVCKHGWDVKMFCFSRALIRQAQIWKCSWAENATNLLYLPIPSSVETWKIFTKHAFLSIFFRLSWHFKREKSVICKASFLQDKNWLREQDFAYTTSRMVRISLLIRAMTKSFAFLSRESYL